MLRNALAAATRPALVQSVRLSLLPPNRHLTSRQESRNNPFGWFPKGYATGRSHFEYLMCDLTSPSPRRNTAVSTLYVPNTLVPRVVYLAH